MKIYTPEELAANTFSKYTGCVVAAKFARKLHDQYRDSTQYLEKKTTSQSLEKLCSGEMNYEIVDRKMTRKKPKTIFSEKS